MSYQQSPLSPDIWLREVFTSKAVQRGEVIRRKIRDIERFAGLEVFRKELQRRGFRAIKNGGQIIVFCNQEPIRYFTPPGIQPIPV
ncbi:MAG: hypothetical protein L3J30_07820 [Marinosulfonomonas sp.]|nr:hypothetical protein [Marinosulfonomonas sp.]